jgi:hypothetical protein
LPTFGDLLYSGVTMRLGAMTQMFFYCVGGLLGVHFARIQLAIAFEELLARATRFRLAEGAVIPRQTGVGLNSPTELHLTFDRR